MTRPRTSRRWCSSPPGPTVLVVHPSVPAKTVQELIALAKTKPGGLSYASAGIGTTPHLVAEQFKLYTGTDITGVQYRGAAPANQDVLAGHVPMTFDLIGNAMNNIKEGKFRALGLTARQRSPLLPDVPTMQEAGLPEMEAGAWFAFFAPAGTPRAAIDWLNREANAIFAAAGRQRPLHRRGHDAAARLAGEPGHSRRGGQQALERGDPQGGDQAAVIELQIKRPSRLATARPLSLLLPTAFQPAAA